MPEIIGRVGCVGLMHNARKQAFRSWSVLCDSLSSGDGNEVFCPRQDESVRIVVARDSIRGLSGHARYTQAPTQSKRPVPISCAVDKIELRLKSISPWRES